jgi:hypothetical protein
MLKKGSGYAFGDIYHELIWSPWLLPTSQMET